MTLTPQNGIDRAVDYSCNQFRPTLNITLDSIEKAVERSNQKYGGRSIQVENVTFVNGGVDAWRIFSVLPEGRPYYNNCPDKGYTGNSSYCLQNEKLGSKVYFIPLGDHLDYTSNLASDLNYRDLNPDLVSSMQEVNSKVRINTFLSMMASL